MTAAWQVEKGEDMAARLSIPGIPARVFVVVSEPWSPSLPTRMCAVSVDEQAPSASSNLVHVPDPFY